ncbi:hypothetical protein BIW11_10890 [Tropilaelaps mercedesae]|uniref:Uncharacterized protein n=1 Tax=Tropilaelaps mercedesae TaxID=418985 RepID=A0A1V9XDJ2_9ACAR|nr:hypothetical protein BIW11_10890 [Tropilaelaps mercedesae]
MAGPAGSPMGSAMGIGSPVSQQRPSIQMNSMGSIGSAPTTSGRGRGRARGRGRGGHSASNGRGEDVRDKKRTTSTPTEDHQQQPQNNSFQQHPLHGGLRSMGSNGGHTHPYTQQQHQQQIGSRMGAQSQQQQHSATGVNPHMGHQYSMHSNENMTGGHNNNPWQQQHYPAAAHQNSSHSALSLLSAPHQNSHPAHSGHNTAQHYGHQLGQSHPTTPYNSQQQLHQQQQHQHSTSTHSEPDTAGGHGGYAPHSGTLFNSFGFGGNYSMMPAVSCQGEDDDYDT